MVVELIELGALAQYVAGFWLFLFSSRFRRRVCAIWRNRTWPTKLLIPVEIAVATSCGLLPLVLIWWAVVS